MKKDDIDTILRDFISVSDLAGIPVTEQQIRVEFQQAPHKRPSTLPDGTQAVYAFILGDTCLKVGKAGPKTKARFTSQHYSPKSAPSTLAKSILKNKRQVEKYVPSEFKASLIQCNDTNIGQWITNSTSRLNIYLPEANGGLVLSLLEIFLQCRLKPLFEGKGE